MSMFESAYRRENAKYEALVTRKNRPADFYNGIYTRWENPTGRVFLRLRRVKAR